MSKVQNKFTVDQFSLISMADIRIDGGTQSREEINEDIIAEYFEAIVDGDEFPPIKLFYDGRTYWLADGFHRYHASAKAGLTVIKASVAQGTRRDAILHACGANATHGLRRSNADKRRAVNILLADEEWSKWSNREIAKRCGVVESYVRLLRKEASAHRAHPDECEGNLTDATKSHINDHDVNNTYAIKSHINDHESDYTEEEEDSEGIDDEDEDQEEAQGKIETIELYTPARYIALVKTFFGGKIDLDPATCEAAQKIVGAKRYFTLADNGLTKPWQGKIFLNPPYGKSAEFSQKVWTRYLLDELDNGNVQEAILLVKTSTGDAWFQELWKYPICFVDHRILFYGPQAVTKKEGKPVKGWFSNVIVYLAPKLDGKRLAKFCDVFSQIGHIAGKLQVEKGQLVLPFMVG